MRPRRPARRFGPSGATALGNSCAAGASIFVGLRPASGSPISDVPPLPVSAGAHSRFPIRPGRRSGHAHAVAVRLHRPWLRRHPLLTACAATQQASPWSKPPRPGFWLGCGTASSGRRRPSSTVRRCCLVSLTSICPRSRSTPFPTMAAGTISVSSSASSSLGVGARSSKRQRFLTINHAPSRSPQPV